MIQKSLDRILNMVSYPLSKAKMMGKGKLYTRKLVPAVQDQVLPKSKAVFSSVQNQLDSFFSITEVKDAQLVVSNIEKEFLEARRLANNMKKELADVRVSLEEARTALDRCPRDSENFLRYVAEEHAIINKERIVRSGYEVNEQRERELFTEYSNAVRVSHEKERERAQKTKYLSIVASITGAIVGFLGSSLVTFYRLKQIRQMTSPDLIISKISQEIKENSLTQDEFNKLFKTNAVTLMEDLDEKLNAMGNEKMHLKDTDYTALDSTEILEKTERNIKNAEDEIKKLLTNFALNVSEVSQSILSGHQASETKVLDNNSDIARINEKLEKIEDNIIDTVNKTSGNLLCETNKTLNRELTKIEGEQRLLKKHIENAKMTTDEEASAEVDLEMNSRTTLYPEANLILSIVSFGLLVFLVINKG